MVNPQQLRATMPTIVKVPVPVACKEKEPVPPIMPTDRLLPGASLDSFVQAASAEIERYEGYEGELRTALRACVAPIAPCPDQLRSCLP